MLKIPKTAYFYWGAPMVPYLRYMCFKTFMEQNPDWKVVVYEPVKLSHASNNTWKSGEQGVLVDTFDYRDQAIADGVIFQPFDMESIGFSNDLPEVHKSDLIRLHLLSTLGGLWSDSDIIYFRPLMHAFGDCEADIFLCYRRGGPTQEDTKRNGPKYHSIGFLASTPNNEHWKKLFDGAQEALAGGYQAVGSPYYKTVFNDETMPQMRLCNIDINTVYPSRALPGMWHGPLDHYIRHIRPFTIGWHWYCGFPLSGEMQNHITAETLHDGPLTNIVTWILREREMGRRI